MTSAATKSALPQHALRLTALGRNFSMRLGRAIAASRSSRAGRLALLAGFVWLALCAAGMMALWRYEHTPGGITTVQPRWPDGVNLALNVNGPTLILFVHPRCPCTRASLSELERVLSSCQGSRRAYVVAYRPASAEAGWEHTDLWRTASKLPGVRLLSDADGTLARRFGATTSGHALVYDASGRLLFDGGITSARGHQGDNAGSNSIIALLSGDGSAVRSTPVFGCPIIPAPNDPTGKP
jgi:hypothetical protein